MRRTLASPIRAISSNSPSAIFAEVLSASIRTARRGERVSLAMVSLFGGGSAHCYAPPPPRASGNDRSEEHTSELQSLMRISYAVFCLKKKKEHTATCRVLMQQTQQHIR